MLRYGSVAQPCGAENPTEALQLQSAPPERRIAESSDRLTTIMHKVQFILLLCLLAAGCQCSSDDFRTPPPATIVYCSQCGVRAGKSTACPGFTKHDFQSANATSKIVCEQCGDFPATNRRPALSSHATRLRSSTNRSSRPNRAEANPAAALGCNRRVSWPPSLSLSL